MRRTICFVVSLSALLSTVVLLSTTATPASAQSPDDTAATQNNEAVHPSASAVEKTTPGLSAAGRWTVGIVVFTILTTALVVLIAASWQFSSKWDEWAGNLSLAEVPHRYARWVQPADRTNICAQIKDLQGQIDSQTLPVSADTRKRLQAKIDELKDELVRSSLNEQYQWTTLGFLSHATYHDDRGFQPVPYFAVVVPDSQFCSVVLQGSIRPGNIEWTAPNIPAGVNSLRPAFADWLIRTLFALVAAELVLGIFFMLCAGAIWWLILSHFFPSTSVFILCMTAGACIGVLCSLFLLDTSAGSMGFHTTFAEFIPTGAIEQIERLRKEGYQPYLFFVPREWRQTRESDTPAQPTNQGFLIGICFKEQWWLAAEVFPGKPKPTTTEPEL